MLLESCTGGHGASKSSRDPKTVDYSPRKRPEMREVRSFDDATRVMYRGSRGVISKSIQTSFQKFVKFVKIKIVIPTTLGYFPNYFKSYKF